MNSFWQQYLLTLDADISTDQQVIFNLSDTRELGNFLHPISHSGIIRVSGRDAVQLLQGQCTCNVKTLTTNTASFGAFCNPKGRVISTFILLQHNIDYLLLLPQVLLTVILKQLQKYILRSDVQLVDCSDQYCLTGIQMGSHQNVPFEVPKAHLAIVQEPLLTLRLGETPARFIVIAEGEPTVKLWSDLLAAQYQPQNSSNWELLDIRAGIPWLTAESSEAYIPQMLNLDQLGGISFNKGCYTGQEIVARTHYLGKAKRAMYLAEANMNQAPEVNTAIIDAENQQVVGTIVASHISEHLVTALIVLTSEASQLKDLYLQNHLNTPLTVL